MEPVVINIFNYLIGGGKYKADLFYENGELIYYPDSLEEENSEDVPRCSYVKGNNYRLSAHRVSQGSKKTEEIEVTGTRIILHDYIKNTHVNGYLLTL
jgi:hypothetical protein